MLTNKSQIKFLWIAALIFSTLACRAASRLIIPDTPTPVPSPTFTPVPSPTDTPTQTVEASCPGLLADIMEATTSFQGGSREADKERYLVTYTVDGDQINSPSYPSVPADFKKEQDDSATQEALWNYFAAIIPLEQRTFVTNFSIITDGKGNILAAVTPNYNDPSLWELDVDILDASNYYSFTFTLIHEFGHLLTLNSQQVSPSLAIFNNPDSEEIYQQEIDACHQYFPGEGCSNPNSYINAFYDRFWTGLYDEWKTIDEKKKDDNYDKLLNDFYYKYKDQFVTDYAPTSPEEDIAESWAFFVLAPKPEGDSIADQKVLFYYEYPELVQLRKEILSRICTEFPQ
ncbi:MAG TPA: hypothetical protein VK206_05810 [Anaerolineales bacterium]|nr:hypothetical protein [Anaerolineales bacterium]HLO27880.1 hypothetical protein [Anaerolineales bacterium]